MKLIGRWIYNIRSSHPQPSIQGPPWRVFMESKVVGVQWPCIKKTTPFLESRSLLVGLIFLNVLPLFMSSTTYHIFQPELKWTCFEEIHMGRTPLCKNYDKVCRSMLSHPLAANFSLCNCYIMVVLRQINTVA